MKRTPSWVFVAFAAVQIGALGLAVWASGRHRPELEPLSLPPENEHPPRLAPGLPEGAPAFVGEASGGRLVFTLAVDGAIRFVDADGGRYAGRAENGRARLRESGGSRAFTVQIGVAPDGRLTAAFTGGEHDGETIALDPLVPGEVA